MFFKRLISLWLSYNYYIIADPSDNSVTLSKKLFSHMRKASTEKNDASSVFVFRLWRGDVANYGFIVNPDIDKPTQLCQIQYNGKYKCVGFESLCPSVGRIFYDYKLPALHPVKLSIEIQKIPQNKLIYIIKKPNEKCFRKYQKK